MILDQQFAREITQKEVATGRYDPASVNDQQIPATLSDIQRDDVRCFLEGDIRAVGRDPVDPLAHGHHRVIPKPTRRLPLHPK